MDYALFFGVPIVELRCGNRKEGEGFLSLHSEYVVFDMVEDHLNS